MPRRAHESPWWPGLAWRRLWAGTWEDQYWRLRPALWTETSAEVTLGNMPCTPGLLDFESVLGLTQLLPRVARQLHSAWAPMPVITDGKLRANEDSQPPLWAAWYVHHLK